MGAKSRYLYLYTLPIVNSAAVNTGIQRNQTKGQERNKTCRQTTDLRHMAGEKEYERCQAEEGRAQRIWIMGAVVVGELGIHTWGEKIKYCAKMTM